MIQNESGRSILEMISVLALIGLITIGSINAYQNGQTQTEVNKITELVSIASLNSLTKMKPYNDANIWKAIGKDKADYKCISSLNTRSNGQVGVSFMEGCEKVKNAITNQWGNRWDENSNIYTPPADEE